MQKQARGRFIWLKDFGNVKCFHAMKEILKYLCCVIIFLHTTVLYPQVPSNYDPLPSWNEGPVKSSIISYVQKEGDVMESEATHLSNRKWYSANWNVSTHSYYEDGIF